MRERGWYWIHWNGSVQKSEIAEFFPPYWFLCACEVPVPDDQVTVLSERLEPPIKQTMELEHIANNASGVAVIDFRDGTKHRIQLNHDTRVLFDPPPPAGMDIFLRFVQGAGSARVSWSKDVRWRSPVDSWGVPVPGKPEAPEVDIRPDWLTIFIIHSTEAGLCGECAGYFEP